VLCVVKVFYNETSGLRILRVNRVSVSRFIIQKQNYLLQGPQGDLGRCPGHQSSGASRGLINHREKDLPTTMKVIDVVYYGGEKLSD